MKLLNSDGVNKILLKIKNRIDELSIYRMWKKMGNDGSKSDFLKWLRVVSIDSTPDWSNPKLIFSQTVVNQTTSPTLIMEDDGYVVLTTQQSHTGNSHAQIHINGIIVSSIPFVGITFMTSNWIPVSKGDSVHFWIGNPNTRNTVNIYFIPIKARQIYLNDNKDILEDILTRLEKLENKDED